MSTANAASFTLSGFSSIMTHSFTGGGSVMSAVFLYIRQGGDGDQPSPTGRNIWLIEMLRTRGKPFFPDSCFDQRDIYKPQCFYV